MAFPAVADFAAATYGAGTTHNVAMPATVNAGDTLIICAVIDNAPTVTAPASPWSEQVTESSGVHLSRVWAKLADGTEGGTTVAVVLSAAQRMVTHVYRITGAYSAALAVEAASAATTTSTGPNSPNLAPSWGTSETLYIAHWAIHNSVTVNNYPAAFTNGQIDNRDGLICLATSRRETNGASLDPAAGNISTSQTWEASTIAIRPAGGIATKMHHYRRRRAA
ncbi:MAG: hypothetical protein ACSLE9_07970 [Burkholderiaceae bacterium]